ncbi:GNAT family N-acetyltransferase [Halomicrococcus sp. SG-WS-1]|uniref:GNAT family N-acetyltransferase n=1 Tax=Halomicrococcus sp. SG-WS-1 TaxID=3439057 RepID=UPI003F7935BC
MQVRRVRNEAADLRRYVEECWLPYHEDLSETVAAHSLIDDPDVQDVVEFHLDLLDSPSNRLWVALDDVDDPTTSLSTADATFAGFVRTSLEPSPQQFDWPDRLEVSDFWVHESYRGSGLADDLIARAMQQAREDGCEELTLDVAIENERAIAYYENLGFEVQGLGMHVPLQDVTLEASDSEPMTGNHSSVHLRRVRVEEDVMDRFVDECWLPFWRDLGDAVGEQHLSPDLDRDALVEDFLEGYDVPDRRCWVALDDVEDSTVGLYEIDAVFAGWLNAGLEPSDRFLDPPERLFVGNLYVGPSYRGSGLADHLVARAIQYAREEGCVELSLGVEVANERAMAYYEKLGFEPHRQRMSVPLDAVET